MIWRYPYPLDGWWNRLPAGWEAVTYSSGTTEWAEEAERWREVNDVDTGEPNSRR